MVNKNIFKNQLLFEIERQVENQIEKNFFNENDLEIKKGNKRKSNCN